MVTLYCGSGTGNIDVDTWRQPAFPPMPTVCPVDPLEQARRERASLASPPQPPQPTPQRPSVGRIVHYYLGDEGPFAAIVTREPKDPGDPSVELHIYDSANPRFAWAWPRRAGTGWCWPPRV